MSFRLFRDTSCDRERERGSVSIIACIFVLFVAAFCSFLFADAMLRGRAVASYIDWWRKEYEREGVFTEAVALLEESEGDFTGVDILSKFASSYTFTITGDTITVKSRRSARTVLRAQIQWEGNRVCVVSAENEFIRPFMQ